jgi:farnesyl-diphosphate farnesyltransferase
VLTVSIKTAVNKTRKQPLSTGLLAAVSRSFYLSLRVLPKPVGTPASLAYLLARAADTIADVPARPAAERLLLLEAFARAVAEPPEESFFAAVKEFSAGVGHEGERTLLTRLTECWKALGACGPEEASLIRTVLQRIIKGQALDLQRFPVPSQPAALPDAAALDEYTWLVAGCVGEFWTEICARHVPRFATLPRAEMIRLATEYGKGLQLVNILRDQPKDMAAGRCYLPAAELRAAGVISLTWPTNDWKPWHAVRRRWLATARERLQSGRAYVRSLTSVRLRFAALLPLLIGEATLDLLDAQPDNEPPQPAKVARGRVKRLMLQALWHAVRKPLSGGTN